MGVAVCTGSRSKNIYFDGLASGDLTRSNSDESVESEDMISAKLDDYFSCTSNSSLKMPTSEKWLRAKSDPQHEQKTGSLKEKIKLEAARRELSKRRYVCALEQRRNTQLFHVTRMAENAIEQGAGILGMMADQREVITTSKRALLEAEEEADEVKGIMSLRGKLVNYMSNPLRNHDHDDASDQLKISHRRSSSVPDLLPSFFGQERHNSSAYQLGVQKLHNALDTLHKQQKDLKDALDKDDEKLGEFGIHMDRVSTKVWNQTRLVKKKTTYCY